MEAHFHAAQRCSATAAQQIAVLHRSAALKAQMQRDLKYAQIYFMHSLI